MRVTTSPTYLTLEDFFFFYFLLLLESQQSCDQYNDNNGNFIIEKEKIKECWNQVGILIDFLVPLALLQTSVCYWHNR